MIRGQRNDLIRLLGKQRCQLSTGKFIIQNLRFCSAPLYFHLNMLPKSETIIYLKSLITEQTKTEM